MDFIMKILCIGDIVSRIGRDMLFKYVDDMKYQKGIDLVIANGENATHGRGLARNAYDELIRAGIDVITMGNHTWDAKEVVDIMRNEGNVRRITIKSVRVREVSFLPQKTVLKSES